tara:strand:- start:1403 stop:1510 length:108 start_codon:yes stop_codon:yes gene_type:complete
MSKDRRIFGNFSKSLGAVEVFVFIAPYAVLRNLEP